MEIRHLSRFARGATNLYNSGKPCDSKRIGKYGLPVVSCNLADRMRAFT